MANPWDESVTALTFILVPEAVFGNDKNADAVYDRFLFPLAPEPEFRALKPDVYQEPDQTEVWTNEDGLFLKNQTVIIFVEYKVVGGMLGNGSRFSHFLGNIDHSWIEAGLRIALLFGLTSK
ncbi:hypothetical protein DSCW_66190 [Desulfosarcina widdelii]|uniref:Uncharacterized protein n=1 Tax=Desulfosarcina widdelii TaxID=947919 RepID=A0A5K7ZAW8_9BACT|nr:hypothetical protein [Desulfosarcina widdelii]BBO79202.1 hypothetical protein DSCW_66190 [Desulfosarcina widdelii]